MNNTNIYIAQNGQTQPQSNVNEFEEDHRPDKATEDMIRYVRQIGKLNKANRQLMAGIERSKFNQST